MAEIIIRSVVAAGRSSVCAVEVSDSGGRAEFVVTVDDEDRRRLAGGRLPVEELVRRSFEFLLQREDKGSILRRFDLMEIARYFPEYEETLAKI